MKLLKPISIIIFLVLPWTTFSETIASKIYKKYSSAVTIIVSTDNTRNKNTYTATGFFVNDEGLLATNRHVAVGDFSLPKRQRIIDSVILFDIKVAKDFEYLICSKEIDLCYIKLDLKNTNFIPFKKDSSFQVGENVYTIGCPTNVLWNIAPGIISSDYYSYPATDIFGEQTSNSLIHTSIPTSPGNSGGPIINEQEELVGISVSASIGGQNLNQSIPLNEILKFNKQIESKDSDKFVLILWEDNPKLMNQLKSIKKVSIKKLINQKSTEYQEKILPRIIQEIKKINPSNS